MTALANDTRVRDMGREAPLIFGGWEVGLLVIMALLYAAGLYLNPAFFGSTDALFSVLRDASRYGVLAIGMTFVIVNKELDLSVGSTFGLTAAIFGMIFAPTYFDMGDLDGGVLVPRRRSGDRADQRLHGHGSGSAGIHRDADDAVHRPRRHPRPHRRQEHRLRNQGGGLSRLLPSGRDQLASASTIRSSSSSSSPRSPPRRLPTRRSAGRPTRSAATSRRRATPASTHASCACAPMCSPRFAR